MFLLKNEMKKVNICTDLHGCYIEFLELLYTLNYYEINRKWYHSKNTPLIIAGDFCDRGPDSIACLQLVMDLCDQGLAYAVLGNHDDKLRRWLKGNPVKVGKGLETTLEELDKMPDKVEFSLKALEFLESLPHHIIFDSGKLVIAHAGLKEELQGKDTSYAKNFCTYGEVDGTREVDGYPVRKPWWNEYKGKALVVSGHIPTLPTEVINNTVCIDTGCVFGGYLTSLSYPEMEITHIKAKKEYCSPREDFKVMLNNVKEGE